MKKARFAALTALVLATLGVFLGVKFSLSNREPVYENKTLTYWLSDFWPGRNPTPEKREQDEFAVRQIGTNAIPILLRWISTKDGPLKQKMVTWISDHARVPFRLESEVDKSMLAVSGFRILGKPQAGSAIPALVEIVRTGGGVTAHHNVTFPMMALANLDPEAATKAGIQFGTNQWSGTNVTVIGWSAPPVAPNK